MISAWVFVEHDGKNIEDVSLEIVGKLNEIKSKADLNIVSIMYGGEAEDLPEKCIGYGSDHAIFLRNEKFQNYDTELYVNALVPLVNERRPDIILVGATYMGRDFAGRLAARLKTGLAANAITLDIDENGILYTGVPGYGGRFIAEIVNKKNRPQISTIRPGVFKKMDYSAGRKGDYEILDVKADEPRVRVKERVKRDIKDISRSDMVVIIGNGAGDRLDIPRKFAEMIGADIGVTRPVADRGLAPRDIQIGSTGLSLSSKLVIVLGSSGSDHFVFGIEKCRTVISIDINRDSNIFKYSDYCVVDDIFKILPVLIERVGKT